MRNVSMYFFCDEVALIKPKRKHLSWKSLFNVKWKFLTPDILILRSNRGYVISKRIDRGSV